MRAGRPGDRRRSVPARRPCAFAAVACDMQTRSSAGAHWLWPAFAFLAESSPSDTHPFCASGFAAASLRSFPRALRRHAPATALPRRINRTRTKHYGHDPFIRTTGPTGLGPGTAQSAASIGPGSWSGASLEVSAPATLAGRARAVRGGRPPDDPASAFPFRQPAPDFVRDLPAKPSPLRFFACSGHVAMMLAWSEVRPERSNRIRRSREWHTSPRRAREPAWRRVDGLLLRFPYLL